MSETYASVCAKHTIYFWLLARAYKFGEISIVYPIARGSGIGLTGFLGWLILDENLNLPGIIGIGSICLGIFCIAFPLVKQTNSVKKGLISALGVGATIVSYSLIDKVGVNIVNPIVYIFGMFFLPRIFSVIFCWNFINCMMHPKIPFGSYLRSFYFSRVNNPSFVVLAFIILVYKPVYFFM